MCPPGHISAYRFKPSLSLTSLGGLGLFGYCVRAFTALQIGVDGVGVIVDPAITPVGGEVFCVLFSAELIENFKMHANMPIGTAL